MYKSASKDMQRRGYLFDTKGSAKHRRRISRHKPFSFVNFFTMSEMKEIARRESMRK